MKIEIRKCREKKDALNKKIDFRIQYVHCTLYSVQSVCTECKVVLRLGGNAD